MILPLLDFMSEMSYENFKKVQEVPSNRLFLYNICINHMRVLAVLGSILKYVKRIRMTHSLPDFYQGRVCHLSPPEMPYN